MKCKSLSFFKILSILFLFSCGTDKFDIDISGVKLDLKVQRLDLDFMANYPDTPDVFFLVEKYGDFLELYNHHIIQIGGSNQKDYAKYVLAFNKYCLDYNIPSKVDAVFGDFSNLESKLETTFRYFKYYFPKKDLPNTYAYISGFQQSIAIDEGILGIALDKYLGEDCELYKLQGIDRYKMRRMHAGMIPVDCIRAIVMSEFPYNDSINNLLNNIVYEGKIQYFLDATMPFAEDTLKFAYTKQQLEWADYNEDKMWAYLVDNGTLFSTDELVIRKMVGDAPFTSLFANNSAPRAGAFLGWKIIHEYMEKNPEISLKELMLDDDYQGILNKAKYRP